MDHVLVEKTQIMGFDFSKFDKRISKQLIMAAYSCLIELALELGYPTTDVYMMVVMGVEFFKPIVNWNRTIVEILGSNPSGNNLTVILNCIVNALLFRCFIFEAWYRDNPTKPIPDFRDIVHATFYGDDGLATLLKRYMIPNVNLFTYRDWLAKHGMKITPPNKDAEFTEFIGEEDADFLKRLDRYHEDLDCHVGALDKGSIFKPLYYRLNSSATDREHLYSVVASVLTESFLHGREFYEYAETQLRKLETHLDENIPGLAFTYHKRVERWMKKFRPGDEQ
jgi:hypothetical protein